MTVVPLPILEVEGKKPDKPLFETDLHLLVISHQDENFISLRLLNTMVTVNAKSLQSAIQSVIKERSRS